MTPSARSQQAASKAKDTDPGSGIRVHYTVADSDLSKQVVMLAVGGNAEANIEIPPNTEQYTVALASDLQLSGPVTVIGWTLHMHNIGVRGRVEHWRDGEEQGLVGCMGYATTEGTSVDGNLVKGKFTHYRGNGTISCIDDSTNGRVQTFY